MIKSKEKTVSYPEGPTKVQEIRWNKSKTGLRICTRHFVEQDTIEVKVIKGDGRGKNFQKFWEKVSADSSDMIRLVDEAVTEMRLKAFELDLKEAS